MPFRAAASLEEAVSDAELVVVAAPVGALPAAVRDVLAAVPEATVTDVGSTKRTLAAIDDPRYVGGHPLAGGATTGPGRASADLFDGATWFVTPSAATEQARVEAVERFVQALGAHPTRIGARRARPAARSHQPPAARACKRSMRAAAGAGEDALRHAAPSLREMTRVAGANAPIWTDIFVDNGDLIADAVAGHRSDLEDVETALRDGGRAFLVSWIAGADDAGRRMLEHAYRTEARLLHRIRIRVPGPPRSPRAHHPAPRRGGHQHRGLRAPPRLARVRRRARRARRGPDKADLARRLLRAEGYAAA